MLAVKLKGFHLSNHRNSFMFENLGLWHPTLFEGVKLKHRGVRTILPPLKCSVYFQLFDIGKRS